jgi:hypothetical protein
VKRVRDAVAASLLSLVTLSSCTGGEDTSAAQTQRGTSNGASGVAANQLPIDPQKRLAEINPAIPLYTGAAYDSDLTRRDNATVADEFGKGAIIYTLTTDDSFPQVWHYYVTYLAQFRRFDPLPPLPPSDQVLRSIDVRLNQVMKDPFVPGDSLEAGDKNVILQVTENEGGSGTLIRYIVRPPRAAPPVVAANPPGTDSSAARVQ